jgi:tetratricopeptide (TPR) repeat protein
MRVSLPLLISRKQRVFSLFRGRNLICHLFGMVFKKHLSEYQPESLRGGWSDRRHAAPNQSLKAFERAMATDPKHENSRFDKGVVLMHDLNDRESAIRAWEELSRINPFYQLPDGKLIEEVLSYKAGQKAQGRSEGTDAGKPAASPSQGQGTPKP